MQLATFNARYEGPLVHVSKDGAYGFVDQRLMRLCYGESGPMPAQDIFVHARDVAHLYRLADNYLVSFRIERSGKHIGKLAAIDVRFHPRAIGILSAASPNGSFAFVKSYDLEVAPEHAQAFFTGIPDDALPKSDVFVHRSKLAGQHAMLVNGQRVSFMPERVREGQHAGRIHAIDVHLIA